MLDPDLLSWIFEFEPEPRLLADLFELRRIIEPESAALAAVRRTNLDLSAMEVALEGMATHSLASELGRQADRDFHMTLLRASGNVFLASLINGVGAAVTWTNIFKQRRQPLPRDPFPDHERVYKAVAASDPTGAQKSMLDLVDFATRDVDNSRITKKSSKKQLK